MHDSFTGHDANYCCQDVQKMEVKWLAKNQKMTFKFEKEGERYKTSFIVFLLKNLPKRSRLTN